MSWAVYICTSLLACTALQVAEIRIASGGTLRMCQSQPEFGCKGWRIPKSKRNRPRTSTFNNGFSERALGRYRYEPRHKLPSPSIQALRPMLQDGCFVIPDANYRS